MLFLVLYARIILRKEYDVIIIDQVPFCIPFLRCFRKSKILYYCHYPESCKTSKRRRNIFVAIYGYFLDWLEEYVTSSADLVFVNSKFTASFFNAVFPSFKNKPQVFYPSVNFSKYDECAPVKDLGLQKAHQYIFLCLSRYERAKNISLALLSLKHLLEEIKLEGGIEVASVHMVIAGAYSEIYSENVAHYNELRLLCFELNLENHVTFLKSPSEEVKISLLRQCTCLLYTPEGEHFGIVPLEAMYCKKPVVAVNRGGPRETVVDEQTGFLCRPTKEHFSKAMKIIMRDSELRQRMGELGYERAIDTFSFTKFSYRIEKTVTELAGDKKKS